MPIIESNRLTPEVQAGLRLFVLVGRSIVVRANGEDLDFTDVATLQDACGVTDYFAEPETGVCAMGLRTESTLPDSYRLVVLRAWFTTHGEQEVAQASRARALLSWRHDSRYCPCCGEVLMPSDRLTSMLCPRCHKEVFPRIDPCIIVVVRREGRILLARHVQRNQDIYACIAGFVECGETIEQAVAREVMEETGLTIQNIRYFGSQSWPFPSQLMLGFTADWKSGEITLQPEEIADAQWFDPHNSPASPAPGSIAYQLIESCK